MSFLILDLLLPSSSLSLPNPIGLVINSFGTLETTQGAASNPATEYFK